MLSASLRFRKVSCQPHPTLIRSSLYWTARLQASALVLRLTVLELPLENELQGYNEKEQQVGKYNTHVGEKYTYPGVCQGMLGYQLQS